MSALTDLFSSFANKIRSKTGSSDTYTPTEMVDAIDDVYDAGVASATTSITPSNSSPVSMSANTGYKPTANGYAISSYSSVTPSSTATSVSTNDIVKIGGSGVIVDSIPTPTSITPSNSTPASLTSGSAVTPTANGYAIESYDSVTPSSTPTSVSTDDIVKFDGSGKIVDDLTSITPSSTPTSVASGDNIHIGGSGKIVDDITNISPSNINPVTITRGETYLAQQDGVAVYTLDDVTPSNSSPVALQALLPVKPSTSGYAISSYHSVTPSDSSPVTLLNGNIYQMSGTGKAVASVTNKTPSDSSPASVSSGAIIKASSAGYLYASSGLGKCKAGTFTSSTSSQTITLGFQPKYLLVMSSALTTNIFDYSYSSTKGIYATSSAGATEYTISGNTSNNHISAISSTGFTFNKSGSSGTTIYYFAVG